MSAARFEAAARSPGAECFAFVVEGEFAAFAVFPLEGGPSFCGPSAELAREFGALFSGLSRDACIAKARGVFEPVCAASVLELLFEAPAGALH